MSKKMLQKIILGAIVGISFLILFFMTRQTSNEALQTDSRFVYNTAQIIGIISDNRITPQIDDNEEAGSLATLRQGTVIFQVEVLRGDFVGQTLEASYHVNSPSHVDFQAGDRVSIRIFEFEGEIVITEIRYPERTGLLFMIIGLFLFFLCLIGGKRGILAVLSIIFTLVCVVVLLIPLITLGYPVVPITLIILSLVAVVSISLLAGLSAKGISAILGTLSGVMLAALFAFIAGILLHIDGYNMANYRAITHLSDGARIGGLFISSVLVAAIGAIMDSCMSVASAMEEVKAAKPEISAKNLFKAGFNVSRDVMGTMSSTLILAFVGGSLAMMIFMYTTDVSFNQLMNNDMITMEIIMGVSGSFGIVLAAPITALICAKLLIHVQAHKNN